MKTLSLLTEKEKSLLNKNLLEIISYRKSGLSLNHVIGCPLDCAYCVRHFFENFEMKIPKLICSDEEAIHQLLNHKYFVPHITPLQIFNRATDPFVPNVKFHTHYILKELDKRGLKNMVLIITRANVTKDDVEMLEQLENLRITILVTYSGFKDSVVEPISKKGITQQSIKTISKFKSRTKLVLYWRPIIVGWNDTNEHFNRVLGLSKYVDAIVYTGYYHRAENHAYLSSIGVNINYDEFSRRKIFPLSLEKRILECYKKLQIKTPLFRKTSCGVSFAHKIHDYNGHWGINELCEICPENQKIRCSKNHKPPIDNEFLNLLKKFDYDTLFLREGGHIWTENLGEEKRYHLQHLLQYQIWDIEKPHFSFQHGRSTVGQTIADDEHTWYKELRQKFSKKATVQND